MSLSRTKFIYCKKKLWPIITRIGFSMTYGNPKTIRLNLDIISCIFLNGFIKYLVDDALRTTHIFNIFSYKKLCQKSYSFVHIKKRIYFISDHEWHSTILSTKSAQFRHFFSSIGMFMILPYSNYQIYQA